ncbi:unnamed protein product, partial [Chrysoparadoxa australica]
EAQGVLCTNLSLEAHLHGAAEVDVWSAINETFQHSREGGSCGWGMTCVIDFMYHIQAHHSTLCIARLQAPSYSSPPPFSFSCHFPDHVTHSHEIIAHASYTP